MNAQIHALRNPEVLNLAPQRSIDAGAVLASLVEIDQTPEGVFRAVKPGPELVVENNYVDRHPNPHPVASQRVESQRGNEALLVDLVPTNKTLKEIFNDARRSRKGADHRLSKMTYEGLARILDTSGDKGLHHIHGSRFPHTVYFNCTSGHGNALGVYLTNLGKEPTTGLPVYGRITASNSKVSEYRVFRALGAGNQKRKYNP